MCIRDRAQSIWSVASLVASTMGPVFITVIGQCMGAGDISQAEQYFRKLTKITVGFALLWNSLIFAATPVLLRFYALEPQTKQLILILVLLHNLFSALAFPFADPLGKGLRAAGDVRFTTAVSYTHLDVYKRQGGLLSGISAAADGARGDADGHRAADSAAHLCRQEQRPDRGDHGHQAAHGENPRQPYSGKVGGQPQK